MHERLEIAGWQLPKSALTKVVVGAAAAFAVLSLNVSDGFAAPHGTSVSANTKVYTASNKSCFQVEAVLRQWHDSIRIKGDAFVTDNCNVRTVRISETKLISYTLWKRDNGTGSWLTCETSGWRHAGDAIETIFQDTFGCGDGSYVLQIHGAAIMDGAWRVGSTATAALDLDVNDHPPIL